MDLDARAVPGGYPHGLGEADPVPSMQRRGGVVVTELRDAEALGAAPIDIEAIRARWCRQCGACDAGITVTCSCPPGDHRPVIEALCDEAQRLQERIDKALALHHETGCATVGGTDSMCAECRRPPGRYDEIAYPCRTVAALSPDTTEALDPAPSAETCIPCPCVCQHGGHDDTCQTPCSALAQAEREGTWPRPSTDTEGGEQR